MRRYARTTCPVCGRDVALTRGGSIRIHRPSPVAEDECGGSWTMPTPRETT